MKILLIPTHLIHVRAIPLGLAYCASYLELHNHVVHIYDPPPYKKDTLIEHIRAFKPDIIGISCMTPTFNAACSIAQKIKSVCTIPIVFGGIHPTSVPRETLHNKYIDYIVIGEGEITLTELVHALSQNQDVSSIKGIGYKDGSEIKINPARPLIENLDDVPLPARELFPLNWYFQRFMGIRGKWVKVTNMISSRGCPYNCTYCASKLLFSRKVRFNSPEFVVKEMELLIKQYKLDGVSFSDDTFSINKDRAIGICKEIKKRKLNCIWRVQMRADTIHEDVIEALAKAGCIQVDVGVESGSDRILNILKKGITSDQILNAAHILKKHRMRLCATFMIGNPSETMEDIMLTRSLASKIQADYTQFFITTPYPGTEMYNDICKRSPEIIKNISYDNFRHGGADLVSLVDTQIPRSDIISIQNELNEHFLVKSFFPVLLTNAYFILDMIQLIIQRPSIILKSITIFFKTFNIIDVFRLWYNEQNFREF